MDMWCVSYKICNKGISGPGLAMIMGCLQVALAAALTSERIGDHLTELQHLARLSLNQAVIMEHPPGITRRK